MPPGTNLKPTLTGYQIPLGYLESPNRVPAADSSAEPLAKFCRLPCSTHKYVSLDCQTYAHRNHSLHQSRRYNCHQCRCNTVQLVRNALRVVIIAIINAGVVTVTIFISVRLFAKFTEGSDGRFSPSQGSNSQETDRNFPSSNIDVHHSRSYPHR